MQAPLVSAPAGSQATKRHRQPILVALIFLVFASADAFSLPFLPIYAESLHRAGGWIDLDLARGLPITTFWLAVAASQLLAGQWERGRDRRMLFLVAIVMGALGLAWAAAAGSVAELAGARILSGFGYGMVLILVQDYLLRAFGVGSRTLATGLYYGLFFGGYLIGAFLGGLLADIWGVRTALGWAAAVSLGAALLLLRLIPYVEPLPDQRLRLRTLVRNGRLMALFLLAAIPARIVNGGFLYLLAPLYLDRQGLGSASIGQVIMIFSVIMAVTTVPWARLVDWTGRPLLFTVIGLLLTGGAMLVIPAGYAGAPGVILSMIMLGTGQAIGMSPQITVLLRVAEAEVSAFGQTGMLGIYRVMERIGLMSGPLLTSWLMGATSVETTLTVIGGLTAVSALALALFCRLPPAARYTSTPS